MDGRIGGTALKTPVVAKISESITPEVEYADQISRRGDDRVEHQGSGRLRRNGRRVIYSRAFRLNKCDVMNKSVDHRR